ncbi:tetratricopeptide repeat protein [Muricoccus aerilatus]|uniref:tetratricopeptide repeat protein n=1 Tax=Muricoccus aerilatus TaxID=452982 RepID=UPI000694024F|nr:tetratricopeptide repeat protein [Roseomonas aerilata]
MALSPAPEGSPAAGFAALLRHHMRVGTRPAGKRGTGAWSSDALAYEIGVASRRTIEYYCNGSIRPKDATPLADTFFGNDPRHALKRNAFLIAFAEATGTEPPAWAFAASNIPVRVPTHFIGRDDALAEIHAALGRYEGRVAITALHGMRGVGKTVLAAAYAEWRRSDYRATWWVRAQTESTMRADIVALGVRLGWVGAEENEDPALATVVERLRHEGEGILLLYDNALDARGLTPHLPRGGAARILVTSNAYDWRGVAQPVEIFVWPGTVGADYLIARTGRVAERKVAEALSDALGGLPLAHEQAAAYCARLEIGFAEYGRRFAAAPTQLLDAQRDAPTEYHDGLTVARTFGLAIEEAAKVHPAAEPLIVHMALLAPEPIPLFLLREGREALGEPLASLLKGEELDEALAALRAFALVDRETIADERESGVLTETVRLHRLVREVVAARPAAEAREAARRTLITALAAVYPEKVYHDPQTWPRARRLDTLALALVESAAGLSEDAKGPASVLLNCLAEYRHGALGVYAQARSLHERALLIRENTLGPEHPDTAMSLNNLALVLREQGDLAGARPLFERALLIRENALGPEHPDTAMSLNNLALLLRGQGDLAGARPLFERALEIRKRVLGPEHPDTASGLNNLALLLRDQGDLAEARSLFECALQIKESTLGPEHPYTAVSLNNLALLLRDQGDLAGAHPLLKRALAILERTSGPEHSHTGRFRSNFARLLLAAGDLEAAQVEGNAALAIHEKALGSQHLWTVDSARVTVDALAALGRTDEAAALQAHYGLSSSTCS